tara:strand:- start:1532 stop:1870 length:339 start_codon:yes stop_codon:yes gene_type:complete
MVEIRSYHYNPEKFEAYKNWAINEAVPYLKANLDIVGFWIDNGDSPEISGSQPADQPIGSANITWIIRWDDMESRNSGHKKIFEGSGWGEIWSRHPDAKGYLQMEARFADEV